MNTDERALKNMMEAIATFQAYIDKQPSLDTLRKQAELGDEQARYTAELVKERMWEIADYKGQLQKHAKKVASEMAGFFGFGKDKYYKQIMNDFDKQIATNMIRENGGVQDIANAIQDSAQLSNANVSSGWLDTITNFGYATSAQIDKAVKDTTELLESKLPTSVKNKIQPLLDKIKEYPKTTSLIALTAILSAIALIVKKYKSNRSKSNKTGGRRLQRKTHKLSSKQSRSRTQSKSRKN